MTTTTTLAGKTILMSGGSRGIGLAIAKRAAQDGANVAIIAKTDQAHPKLEGTVHTAAAEIEASGGRAPPARRFRARRGAEEAERFGWDEEGGGQEASGGVMRASTSSTAT